MATIAGKEAKAQRDMVAAQKDQASIKQILGLLAGQNIQTQKTALEAALAAISVPGAVRVADTMLHESGFVSRTEEDEATATAVTEAQQMQEQQAAQQQQQMAAQQQGQAEQSAGLQQFQQ